MSHLITQCKRHPRLKPILRDLKLEEEVLKEGLNIPPSSTIIKGRNKERENQHQHLSQELMDR
jgi:hypothetical protein